MAKNNKYVYAILGILSFIYLLNLGFGFLEIIPDAIPLWGNLDEFIAVVVLLKALEHFGIKIPFVTEKLVKSRR